MSGQRELPKPKAATSLAHYCQSPGCGELFLQGVCGHRFCSDACHDAFMNEFNVIDVERDENADRDEGTTHPAAPAPSLASQVKRVAKALKHQVGEIMFAVISDRAH